MANNFTLSPEDRRRWQQRAPRASYWFGVSNTHPFINGGQPTGMTPPPPPYSPALPTPPAQAFQPYFGDNQPLLHIPEAVQPGPIIQLPLVNPVPIYDVHQNRDMGDRLDENIRPSLPPRKLKLNFVWRHY